MGFFEKMKKNRAEKTGEAGVERALEEQQEAIDELKKTNSVFDAIQKQQSEGIERVREKREKEDKLKAEKLQKGLEENMN